MLSQLPESSVKDHYLNRASEFIGYDAYMLESEDALATTEATQMALFICGVIGAQSLRKAGVRPSFVAGHSVGAFAAAVVAGSLPFETGLQIVAYRGCLMHAAFPSGYGMGVIVGLTETAVAKLLEEISADYPEVYLAIVNARNQIVVTGPVEDVDAVLQFALERCARRTQRLPVGVPSHCRLLQGVVEKLRRSFKSEWSHPPPRGSDLGRPYRERWTSGTLVRRHHSLDRGRCFAFHRNAARPHSHGHLQHFISRGSLRRLQRQRSPSN
jgi:malonate decarboxylase epsilon subunit